MQNIEKQNWHSRAVEDVVDALQTDIKNGLSTKEYTARVATYGSNTLTQKKQRSVLVEFLFQVGTGASVTNLHSYIGDNRK